ncbi:MAG: TonB-dependent receptor [Pseudomonadota bacterium]
MNMKSQLVTGATGLSLLIASPVLAQEEPFDLGTIKLSTFRSNAAATTIPGAVQVITEEDLERRVKTGERLERILSDFVPGLTVSNGTIGGASQTLRGRGLQILINGVSRTSELRGFDRELALIDTNSIERIEIVRGSNAQFGNGATGGTINIITKQAGDVNRTEVITSLTAQDEDVGDSFGGGIFVAHDRRIDELGLRFEFGADTIGDLFDGDGRQIPSDPLVGQGGGDNQQNYTLGFALDYTAGSHQFDLRFDYNRFEQDIEFFTDYGTDPVSVDFGAPYTGEPVEDETGALTVSYRNNDLGIGELELQAFFTDNRRQAAFVPVGIANPLYYPISTTNLVQDPNAQTVLDTRTYGLRSTVRSDLSTVLPGLQVTWGADLARDEVEQSLVNGVDVIAPMEQTSVAAFAQFDVALGERFDLSGGVRYERFDLTVQDFVRPDAAQLTAGGVFALPALNVIGGDFDYDAFVFNLGGVYHVTSNTSVFAGFSQGFSIPDVGAFTRRALAPNPFIPGQTISYASIAPEAQIVDNYEVGVRFLGPAVSLSASAFFATSDEGTIFDAATGQVFQRKEETWGGEIIADYRVQPGFNLGMALSYTEGRFDSDDDGNIDAWLPNNRIVSPFKATLYGDYEFDNGLRLAGEVVFTGERNQTGLSKVQDTTTVNLRVAKAVGPGEFRFAVDNLLNTDQLNPTATSVRVDPLTGENVPVSAEGRRFWLGYAMTF